MPHSPQRALTGRRAPRDSRAVTGSSLRPILSIPGGAAAQKDRRGPSRTAPPLTLCQRGQGGAAPQPLPQSTTARPPSTLSSFRLGTSGASRCPAGPQRSQPPTTRTKGRPDFSATPPAGGSASFAPGTGEILISSPKSGRE
ncbi:hypothetical protein NDU88_005060 [Pleurodeles waltl]|uniref:Uncharacterized protein n=1 Tax=Pleurodeles waltl TaxID=8319 RepID=A0AAV7TT87_PLEWA|nr:hypothetical protein NDU88_005060 [Pleurodeles waltl]